MESYDYVWIWDWDFVYFALMTDGMRPVDYCVQPDCGPVDVNITFSYRCAVCSFIMT